MSKRKLCEQPSKLAELCEQRLREEFYLQPWSKVPSAHMSYSCRLHAADKDVTRLSLLVEFRERGIVHTRSFWVAVTAFNEAEAPDRRHDTASDGFALVRPEHHLIEVWVKHSAHVQETVVFSYTDAQIQQFVSFMRSPEFEINTYTLSPTPLELCERYQCGVCDLRDVKLWRESYVFAEDMELFCATCATAELLRGSDPKKPPKDLVLDARGTHWVGYTRTSHIGSLVPAVIDPEDNRFFGVTSIPTEHYERWQKLPTYSLSTIKFFD